MSENTTVQITKATRKRLNENKLVDAESHDEQINRLLDEGPTGLWSEEEIREIVRDEINT